MEIEVLLFRVDEVQFAVSSTFVREVVRAAKLSPLPRHSRLVEGLLNLRGRIVPTLGVRQLFALPEVPLRHTDHFVIIKHEDATLALRVDRAVDLARLSPGQMQPSNLIVDAAGLVESTGCLGDEVVHLLNVVRLFRLDDHTLAEYLGPDATETSL